MPRDTPRTIHAHSLPIHRFIAIGAANKRGSKNEARVSNAGNIKSPFNIFTSGGENDEVSCFLIMHSRAPEPRNSRLRAGILPPGKPALLLPHFLPLFLPSLSVNSRLLQPSFIPTTNVPLSSPYIHLDILPRGFSSPLHIAAAYILFPRAGEQVLSSSSSSWRTLTSSLSVQRGHDYRCSHSANASPFLFPSPASRTSSSAALVDFRPRASPFAFQLPASRLAPPFSPSPFPDSSFHPSLYPSGLCLFLK